MCEACFSPKALSKVDFKGVPLGWRGFVRHGVRGQPVSRSASLKPARKCNRVRAGQADGEETDCEKSRKEGR